MIEKRKYPRFQLKVNASYEIVSRKDIKLSKAINISAEGVCFESHEKFNMGTQVNLKVNLADKSLPVNLVGEIRWSEEIEGLSLKEKMFINGVNLIDIDKSDEGRFLKYYCDKMIEKLSGYLKA